MIYSTVCEKVKIKLSSVLKTRVRVNLDESYSLPLMRILPLSLGSDTDLLTRSPKALQEHAAITSHALAVAVPLIQAPYFTTSTLNLRGLNTNTF